MTISQILTISAVPLLTLAAFLSRHHLHQRRGLRFIFIGLFVATFAGVSISFSSSVEMSRVLAIVMLAGMASVVTGIGIEKHTAISLGHR